MHLNVDINIAHNYKKITFSWCQWYLIFTASLLGLPFILYNIPQALSLNTHHLKTKAFNSFHSILYNNDNH